MVQWRIKSHVALTRDEVLQVFTQLCLALEAMHMNPVEPLCHRDVKPHNILLKTPLDGPDMSSQSRWRDLTKTEAVLMDFGSVKPATCCISSRSQALQTQEDAEVCGISCVGIFCPFLVKHCTRGRRYRICGRGYCTRGRRYYVGGMAGADMLAKVLSYVSIPMQ